MTYTVKKLSQLSGVSIRTLHHYDDIGLLKPERVNGKGYRFYGMNELLRLQQILFYRELGLPLVQIKSLLDEKDFDPIATLRSHQKALEQERERTTSLIETLQKTIAHLEGGHSLSDKEIFMGFDVKKQAEYEQYIADRYGASELVEESRKNTRHWKAEDFASVKSEMDRLHRSFTALLEQGLTPDAPAVQTLTKEHFAWVSRFYTPTKEVYSGLGRLYVEHPDFRRLYDGYHENLASFLAAAMQVHADRDL